MSRIDVVIPCYNYAHYLRECVHSVLSQEGVNVRVLIIDDCSQDDSAAVGAGLAAQDSRVEFRRHEVNRGHIATYNEGLLQWAIGEYLVLLSADDMLTTGALPRAAEVLDAYPQVGMVYGRAIATEDPTREFTRCVEGSRGRRIMEGSEFIRLTCEAGGTIVPTPAVVVRGSVQRRIGGYRADLPHSGDLEMWLRIAANSHVCALDADQAIYRVHTGNMHRTYIGVPDALATQLAFNALFDSWNSGSPVVDRLRATANASLARRTFWVANKLFEEGRTDEVAECLRFVIGLDPRFRKSLAWTKMRIKQLMGRRNWARLREAVRGARRSLRVRPPCPAPPMQNDVHLGIS
ncbi:MAG TPA: glycosyltransferase [Tepidisphaeraceae bacterium]